MMKPPTKFILNLNIDSNIFLETPFSLPFSQFITSYNNVYYLDILSGLNNYDQKTVLFFTLVSCSLFFCVLGFFLLKQRTKKYHKINKFKFIEIRENERRKLAKSLHDEVVGDIIQLNKRLRLKNLTEEWNQLHRVKENVRSLSHQLASISFDEIPFPSQIINLTSDYLNSGLNLNVQGLNDVDWSQLNTALKRVIYLSVREGIYNVEKHAFADHVLISFLYDSSNIIISISDDGKGFDANQTQSGIGLKNIRDRVEEIEGMFCIKTGSNLGTELFIKIPIL